MLGLRPTRPALDPWLHQGVLVEAERTAEGGLVRSATVFLTGRECAWRCLMCDLWRHTIAEDTPAGAIPAQIAAARADLGAPASSTGAVAEGPPAQLKLYNAGSFFDPRAVPPDDYEAIAAQLTGLTRVVVECHPALVGSRIERFLSALDRHQTATTATRLEVAIGLETAHPVALERLNKQMTVEHYVRACGYLLEHGVSVRTFLLINPPFIGPEEQRDWLFRSIEVAIAAGSSVISLIPTRMGNGAMEEIARRGQFTPLRLDDVEDAAASAVSRYAGRARVFIDVWDLRRFARCGACAEARVARLHRTNLEQRVPPPCRCSACEAMTA